MYVLYVYIMCILYVYICSIHIKLVPTYTCILCTHTNTSAEWSVPLGAHKPFLSNINARFVVNRL